MSDRSIALRASLLLVASLVLSACSGPEARTARYLERGQKYQDAGNLEKAELEFRNALQVSPNIAEVRLRNGLIEEKLGNYQKAAQLYQGTLDLDNHSREAAARLAKLYLFSGAIDQAMKLIEQGLAEHPDSVELLAYRAAAHGRLNEPAEAIADAEQAVKLGPSNETALVTLAGLYVSGHRDDEARALLEAAAQRLPGSVDVHEVLVQFYASHNEIPKAEELLKRLVQLQPKERQHRISLARFYVATDRPVDAERTLREACAADPGDKVLRGALLDLLATKRGRDVAEQEVQRLVAADRKDYDLQLLLGSYYEQDKAFDKAESTYRAVIKAEDKNPAALTARVRLAAMALVNRKDAAQAKGLLAEVLTSNPRDSQALVLRSQIALAEGDTRSAIVDLRTVVRDHPEVAAAQRQLARAYMANGDAQLAEDTLRQSMGANPADDAARTDLVNLYLQSNRAQAARPLVEDLVKREPKSLEYRQLQFRVLASLKDYAGAEAAAAALRGDKSSQGIGWYFSGLVAEAQGHDEAALKDYDQAVQADGRAQEPLSAEVRLLQRAGKGEAALARVSQAVSRYPDNMFAVNLRGEIYAGMKRWSEAAVDFDLAAANSPQWWVPYRNQAVVKVGQKDMEGAVKILREAATKLGQPDPLVAELSGLLVRMGRSDDAIAAYELALQQNPKSDFAANNLAMLLASNHGDAARLARAAEIAARFEKSANPDYLDTSGWVLLQQGKAALALPVFEKAASLAAQAPVIRYHLALAQFAAGQKQQARDNLERALKGKQEFEGIADARAKLAEWKQAG